MTKRYGPFKIADFKVGDRIEIAEGYDHWTKGNLNATVIKVGKTCFTIALDRADGGEGSIRNPNCIHAICS